MDLWFTEPHTETCAFTIKVKKQLHHEISPFQRIDFFDSYDFGVFFTLDGYMMVNEKDEFIYHDMIAHVPKAVNPGIRKALVIGGGDGGSVRELLRYPDIERVDLVEIDRRVVELCRQFLPSTAGSLDDDRVHIHYEDGVAFVSGKEDAYDLILVDSTDPIGPGEGLFTESFYRDCKKALKDNGILINQHESPYYENDAREMQRAHEKLKKVFEVCEVYQFHMPTYPSGHWLFGFASKGLHPVRDMDASEWEAYGLKTKYYNTALHAGAFALPTYVKEMLDEKCGD